MNEDLGAVLLASEDAAGRVEPAVLTRYRIWPGQEIGSAAYLQDKPAAYAVVATVVPAAGTAAGARAGARPSADFRPVGPPLMSYLPLAAAGSGPASTEFRRRTCSSRQTISEWVSGGRATRRRPR